MAAGAVGLTVGTLGEAEVFAAGGLGDLFLAYPLSARGPRAARLAELAARDDVGRGRPRSARRSRPGARRRRARPGVLVEIDSGSHRTGVDPGGRRGRRRGSRARARRGRGVHPRRPRLRGAGARDAADDEEVPPGGGRRGHGPGGDRGPDPERRVHPDGCRLGARRRDRGAPGTYVFGDRQQVALEPSRRTPSRPSSWRRWSAAMSAAAASSSTPGPRSWARTWRPTWPAHGESPELPVA